MSNKFKRTKNAIIVLILNLLAIPVFADPPICADCLDFDFVEEFYESNPTLCQKALCPEDIPINDYSYLIVIAGFMLIFLVFYKRISSKILIPKV